jgi:hypothetical protein
MVEAVIALPLFIVIFVGVLYVRDLVLVHQRAEGEARTCAWLYSETSCTEIPPGCAGIVGTPSGTRTSEEAGLVRRVTEGLTTMPAPIGGAVNDLIEPAVAAAFGRSVTATARRDISRPVLLGGGEKEVSASYGLPCNLAPQTPEQVAADAWALFGL